MRVSVKSRTLFLFPGGLSNCMFGYAEKLMCICVDCTSCIVFVYVYVVFLYVADGGVGAGADA